MLTLQSILESDSLSSVIAKLNNNFQVLSLAGGGPMGIRGDQGIPGIPGRIGSVGPTGPKGETGVSAYMIPFATGTTGSTGPSSVAGPWPTASLSYLQTTIGTGSTGNIYIDHYNNGYWMYLTVPDATGQYSNLGGAGGTYPPGGTGYYYGAGWYFYPTPGKGGAGSGDVWELDYSTYLSKPPYGTGPFDSTASPLTIPNARFSSKYGSIWVTAGNSGNTGNTDYDTSSIYDWGYDWGNNTVNPQPGRYNAGVDRLLFKFSLDSLPYHSVVNARRISALNQAANAEANDLPDTNFGQYIAGVNYWPKPMYSTPLDQYTPLFFWSEVRPTGSDVDGNERFSSLGLYQYTATAATEYGTFPAGGLTAGVTGTSIFWKDKKSIFLLSSRLSMSPDDYQEIWDNSSSLTSLNNQKTINIAELVLDVKTLTTTNQLVCALPQDLKLSSEYVDGGVYDESSSSNPFKYRVYQGFISAANGKNVGGSSTYTNYIDFGANSGTPLDPSTLVAGNQVRRSWYGSAFRFDDISQWSNGSSDPLQEGYSRLAGMTERGKKTWSTSNDDTFFLSELIFYSSQFKVSGTVAGTAHNVSSQDINAGANQQNSLPSFYISPFRSIGIGTFTADDLGVWEPAARFHAHVNTGGLTAINDPSTIYKSLTGTSPASNKLIYSTSVTKVGAFTATPPTVASQNNLGFVDIYLGKKGVPAKESANPYSGGITPITSGTGSFRLSIRREGWYTAELDSFRIGAMPSATGTDIGQSLNSYTNEYQFSVHPLNKLSTDPSNSKLAISGIGIHNLWPRSRAHFFGKNKFNEADRGDENIYAGYAATGGVTAATGAFPYYQGNFRSDTQIIQDYMEDTYLYPTGILEYDYITYQGLPFGGGTANTGVYSPNAANHPNRDFISPTRHYVPYGQTGNAGALYGPFWNSNFSAVQASTGAFNGSYRHGGTATSSYKANKYIGFNLFRDLVNVGDAKETTNTWVLGTNGGLDNGGSAILTNSDGDFGIATIKSGRNGGRYYTYWEQKLSTRDVLNNIKVIVKKDGSVGFGNAAGYDPDAYSSVERNINTGFLNYVPFVSDTTGTNAIGVGPFTAGSRESYTINVYTGNGTSGHAYGNVFYPNTKNNVESATASTAAGINKTASVADSFRAEFAADKLHGRPGRTVKNGGWGYPASPAITTSFSPFVININTLSDIRKYVVLTSTYSSSYSSISRLELSTDFEGRLVATRILWSALPSGVTAGTSGSSIYSAIILPHPTEFNTGGPLNSYISGASFTAPVGAVAGAWDGENVTLTGLSHYLKFEEDPLILGNIRLNNFVAGEGLGMSGGNTGSADALAVKLAKQTSPKLVFTFMEGDNPVTPGAAGSFAGNRPISGTAAYRKVNTVIASAQNESSLREYWIPKSDNTGGTFMVFTDHYGQKEKNGDGFDNVTINMNRMLLEEVVTLEYLYGYTGGTGGYPRAVTGATSNAAVSYGAEGLSGGTASWPAHVIYKNRSMLEKYWPYFGYTGPASTDYQELFSGAQYAKIYNYGPSPKTTGIRFPTGDGTEAPPNFLGRAGGGILGSTFIRNIDKFYSIYNPDTNFENGWGDSEVSNKASEMRFRRINTDFALIDFNITIDVRNPNLDWNVAPGEVPSATGATSSIYFPSEVIDRCSPRWTQFIRMKYFPSAGDTQTFDATGTLHERENLFLENLFGNGLTFANWSAFRNWYPGVAVVGPARGIGMSGTNTTTSTGEPHYLDNSAFAAASGCLYYNRWNGNLLNFALSEKPSANSVTNYIEPQNTAYATEPGSPDRLTYTWETARKTDVWPIYNAPLNMFNNWTSGYTQDKRSVYFSTYLGDMFQLMGNRAFSRTRNCMWRIVPEFANYYNNLAGGTPSSSGSVQKNSFVLEVMFDDPILHIDIPLRDDVWGGGPSTSVGSSPYFKYLTVSGQSMLRFVKNANFNWIPSTLPPAPGSQGLGGPCGDVTPPTPTAGYLFVSNISPAGGSPNYLSITAAAVGGNSVVGPVSGSNFTLGPVQSGTFSSTDTGWPTSMTVSVNKQTDLAFVSLTDSSGVTQYVQVSADGATATSFGNVYFDSVTTMTIQGNTGAAPGTRLISISNSTGAPDEVVITGATLDSVSLTHIGGDNFPLGGGAIGLFSTTLVNGTRGLQLNFTPHPANNITITDSSGVTNCWDSSTPQYNTGTINSIVSMLSTAPLIITAQPGSCF